MTDLGSEQVPSPQLYNPIIDSLRGLQQVSQLKSVQNRLGVERTSLGSLSESATIFDPEKLKDIANELNQALTEKKPDQFQRIDKRITAVEGSIFKTLTHIARLAWLPRRNGKSVCG